MQTLLNQIIKDLEQTIPEDKSLDAIKAELLEQTKQLKLLDAKEFYLNATGGKLYGCPELHA